MPTDVVPFLVTVMAGYAKTNDLTALSKRWINSLRLISSKLILVYDQDQLASLPDWVQDIDNVELFVRRHHAYDFGSYRLGLNIAEERGWLQEATHLLLCNDSVVGPFGDLYDFVQSMLRDEGQIWCISESNLYRPHMQSYFMLFSREVFLSKGIREFFREVVSQPSRHDVIQFYELGFSKLICELGLKWKAYLSSDEMYDPRNGNLIGNITSYPLCMLNKGAPIVKVKSLYDPNSNHDGLSRTCTAIARSYPGPWQDLMEIDDLRVKWQSSITVGIVLSKCELLHISDCLNWISSHPHANLKAIIALEERAIDSRAELIRQFDNQIREGSLAILVVDDFLSREARLAKLLAAIGTDWVVFACEELWLSPGALQCQIRRISTNPNRDYIEGFPFIWNQNYCFSQEGWQELVLSAGLSDHHH